MDKIKNSPEISNMLHVKIKIGHPNILLIFRPPQNDKVFKQTIVLHFNNTYINKSFGNVGQTKGKQFFLSSFQLIVGG